MNNVITASRMATLISCPRRHFWGNEIGLQKSATALALRFGSAWHRGMEARWKGASYDEALALAIPEGIELGEYDCATLSALLAGYYDYYGAIEEVGQLEPEIQFSFPLEGFEGFTAEGKIDGLGRMKDGRPALIESKTTGDSIDPSSDYWLRLTFNMQVYQYADAAIRSGWDVPTVFYDVTRKPSIRPKQVYDLDQEGRKIVIDANGKRIYAQKKTVATKGRGKSKTVTELFSDDLTKPRQSGDEAKGWTLKSHVETPDEFCDRLWKDTLARPAFYFVRREVAILENDLEAFSRQRESMARVIEHFRSCESGADHEPRTRDPEAWPRNVSSNTCDLCSFKSFCLQNINIDINHPPEGFAVKAFNPELEQAYDTTEPTPEA